MREIRLCDDCEKDYIYNLCLKNNLGVEIQGFYNTSMINSGDSDELIIEYDKLFKDFQYGKSLHAPFWDLNLGSKNKDVRDATMKAFNYAYDVAKKLGCTEIVVHNGFVPNTSYYEGWTKNAVSFWEEFFSDKDDSITMMIENQCEEDATVLQMEIDAVNDPRLKVCLDIGHAHANSNISVLEWIATLGDRIGYLHLHDNHGKVIGRPSFKNDEHLGLGEGTIALEEVFKLLEEYAPNAIWNIECKLSSIEESIDLLKRLGYIK